MFKKLLVMLGLVTSVSIFADEVEGVKWNWNLDDEASIKNSILNPELSEETKNSIINMIIPGQLALVGKNAENITYEEYKAILKDAFAKKYSENQKLAATYTKTVIPQFSNCITRFHAFQENVINDPELLASAISNSYIATWIGPRALKTAEAFRKYYFIDKNIFNVSGINPFKRIFEKYNKFSKNYTDEEIKSDMKIFKRIIYPKIAKGDEWKDLAVNIELVMKSVE